MKMPRPPFILRLSVFAAAVLVAVVIAGKIGLLPSLGIFREEKSSVSDLLLQEIRDVFSLSTVEGVYKSVFPHDYMSPGVSFDSILFTLRNGKGSVKSLLSPEEQEYLDARNLASRLGLRMGKGTFDFVVVTTLVKGGFDLSGTALDPSRRLSDKEREQLFEIGAARDPNTGRITGRSIRIELPPPVVTDVIIEDPKPENYPFPDVKIRPDQWKKLAAFTEERARRKALEEGLLEAAEAHAREFLRVLLEQGGFAEVVFSIR